MLLAENPLYNRRRNVVHSKASSVLLLPDIVSPQSNGYNTSRFKLPSIEAKNQTSIRNSLINVNPNSPLKLKKNVTLEPVQSPTRLSTESNPMYSQLYSPAKYQPNFFSPPGLSSPTLKPAPNMHRKNYSMQLHPLVKAKFEKANITGVLSDQSARIDMLSQLLSQEQYNRNNEQRKYMEHQMKEIELRKRLIDEHVDQVQYKPNQIDREEKRRKPRDKQQEMLYGLIMKELIAQDQPSPKKTVPSPKKRKTSKKKSKKRRNDDYSRSSRSNSYDSRSYSQYSDSYIE